MKEAIQNKLPQGWEIKKLGEVCEIIMGQSPPSDTYNSSKQGLPFYQGNASFTDLHPVAEKWCDVPSKIALPDDILLSVRAPVGDINMANEKCCIGRGLSAIRYPQSPKFIFYYLKFIGRTLDEKGTGTTFKAISGKIIREQEIPFPSVEIQQKIVAKLEKLFADLNQNVAQLTEAKKKLKIYRQSVLKFAFEGKLTKESVNQEPPLVKLNDVAEVFGGYAFKSSLMRKNGSYQVLRMGNVKPGVINGNKKPVFIEADKNQLDKSLLKLGDIVITLTGTKSKRDYGFTAEVIEKNYLLNQRLACVRFKDNIFSKYFLFFSYTDEFKNQFFEYETGNVGQGNVGMRGVTDILLPIFSENLRKEIVQAIESRLSVADAIEQQINASLKQTEILRQSILKEAFEGRLLGGERIALVKPNAISLISSTEPVKVKYYTKVQTTAAIVWYSNSTGIEHGDMTVMKFLYLLDKIYDIPTGYIYGRGHLGPYTQEVYKVIKKKEFFRKSAGHLKVIAPEKLLKNFQQKDSVEQAVTKLTSIFNKYKPDVRAFKIELLATVCKVVEDIQSLDLSAVRQSMKDWPIDLKDSSYKNKAQKFSEAETKKCLTFLVNEKWNEKLITG